MYNPTMQVEISMTRRKVLLGAFGALAGAACGLPSETAESRLKKYSPAFTSVVQRGSELAAQLPDKFLEGSTLNSRITTAIAAAELTHDPTVETSQFYWIRANFHPEQGVYRHPSAPMTIHSQFLAEAQPEDQVLGILRLLTVHDRQVAVMSQFVEQKSIPEMAQRINTALAREFAQYQNSDFFEDCQRLEALKRLLPGYQSSPRWLKLERALPSTDPSTKETLYDVYRRVTQIANAQGPKDPRWQEAIKRIP